LGKKGFKRGKKTVKDAINDTAKRMNENIEKYPASPVKNEAKRYVERLKKNQKSLKDATTWKSIKKEGKSSESSSGTVKCLSVLIEPSQW
jgi:hypothetical protein